MRDRDEMNRAMMMGAGIGMGESAMGAGRDIEVPTRENMREEEMRKSAARRAERMRPKSLGEEAMEAAKSYGRLYKEGMGMKKGGKVKKYKKGGTVSSASKRADGCAIKGKTKGRFV